jgi:general stress protein CsbA
MSTLRLISADLAIIAASIASVFAGSEWVVGVVCTGGQLLAGFLAIRYMQRG